MDALNVFMSDHNFPKALCTRLREYITNARELTKNARYSCACMHRHVHTRLPSHLTYALVLTWHNRYNQIVQRLSPQLQGEVSEMNTAWLKNLYFLENASVAFFVAVLPKISISVYEPGEKVNWANSFFRSLDVQTSSYTHTSVTCTFTYHPQRRERSGVQGWPGSSKRVLLGGRHGSREL